MTKDEAIEAMKRGEKVTHEYFCSNEWMTIKDGQMVFEDGIYCDPKYFWLDRRGEGWQQGYSLFKPAR